MIRSDWPVMPEFGDPSYDRSEWLLDIDIVQLMREHREILHLLADLVAGAGPEQLFETPNHPRTAALHAERARSARSGVQR